MSDIAFAFATAFFISAIGNILLFATAIDYREQYHQARKAVEFDGEIDP